MNTTTQTTFIYIYIYQNPTNNPNPYYSQELGFTIQFTQTLVQLLHASQNANKIQRGFCNNPTKINLFLKAAKCSSTKHMETVAEKQGQPFKK